MDFVMTFVVFIFALSIFFFSLGNSAIAPDSGFDVSSELLFNRMEQISDKQINFLDGARINSTKLVRFIVLNPTTRFEYLFSDFESRYKTEVCVYLENKNEILKYFNAYKEPIDMIDVKPGIKCGDETGAFVKVSNYPKCLSGSEAIMLSKPVLYNNEIVSLKVLLCAK